MSSSKHWEEEKSILQLWRASTGCRGMIRSGMSTWRTWNVHYDPHLFMKDDLKSANMSVICEQVLMATIQIFILEDCSLPSCYFFGRMGSHIKPENYCTYLPRIWLLRHYTKGTNGKHPWFPVDELMERSQLLVPIFDDSCP